MKITGSNYKIIAGFLSVIVLAVIYLFQFASPLVRDALAGEINYEELARKIETQINSNVGKNGFLVENYVELEGRSLRIFYRYDRFCSERSPGLGLLRREVYLDLAEFDFDVEIRDNTLDSNRTVLEFNFRQEIYWSMRQLSEVLDSYIRENRTQGLIDRLENVSQIEIGFLEEHGISSRTYEDLCGGVSFNGALSNSGSRVNLGRGDYPELAADLSKYIEYISTISS